jgi:hypothetical protein
MKFLALSTFRRELENINHMGNRKLQQGKQKYVIPKK